jgi:Cytochrome c
MTKPQIWVAAFLIVFVLLFLLERATNKTEVNNAPTTDNPMPQSNISSENLSPEQLIGKLGCVNCHGQDLTGTNIGPNLHNVSQYWSRDKLINYLRNPSSFMDADRFKAYQQKYPSVFMPSFNQISPKDLGKVAEYLIKLK